MASGLSHITLIVSDLDQTQEMLERMLDARCVYQSGEVQFSLSEERFFLVGDVWLATMLGEPLPERSYNHFAFAVADELLEERQRVAEEMGLDIRPPRPRIAGEGRSLYFYGPDNHLFELHSGTLETRLAEYQARGAPDA